MLLEHLRAGDLRCVRTTVSSVTARRRREPQALASIDGILSELRDSFDPHGVDISLPPQQRAFAAELVALLAIDDSPMRARLGNSPGVVRALVGLVDEAWRYAAAIDPNVTNPSAVNVNVTNPSAATERFLGAEAAAEALWILSFNSPSNHAALVAGGAVQALAGALTARDAFGVQTPARMSIRSPDWLESSSALGALHHLRQGCEDETGSEDGVSSAPIRMTTVASGAVVSAVARAAREGAREQPVWAGDEPGDGPPAGVYAGRAR